MTEEKSNENGNTIRNVVIGILVVLLLVSWISSNHSNKTPSPTASTASQDLSPKPKETTNNLPSSPSTTQNKVYLPPYTFTDSLPNLDEFVTTNGTWVSSSDLGLLPGTKETVEFSCFKTSMTCIESKADLITNSGTTTLTVSTDLFDIKTWATDSITTAVNPNMPGTCTTTTYVVDRINKKVYGKQEPTGQTIPLGTSDMCVGAKSLTKTLSGTTL